MRSLDLPLLIVNPRAGRGITEQRWASMVAIIGAYLGPFECEFTKGPSDAARIAEEHARKGRRWIIAIGGDGTVSEVSNGILRSGQDTVLSILPGGTGGDFRRTLGVPGNLARAAEQLKNASVRRMDVGRIQYVNRDLEPDLRYFINTASFGMSGFVAGRANQSKKYLGGGVTYAIATMKTLLKFQPPEVNLKIEDRDPVRLRIITVCVANGPSFGGGMRIAPNAQPDDGVFDVIAVGDLKILRILLSSYRLYTGSFLSLDKVAEMRARTVEASPCCEKEKIPLEVDGETPGFLPAKFKILPAALSIRA